MGNKSSILLFLTKPQRQKSDLDFYSLLEELRFGNLSEKSKSMINEKTKCSQNCRAMISITYVVGLHDTSEKINLLICKNLPFGDHAYCSIADVVLEQSVVQKHDYHPFLDHDQFQEISMISEG